MSRRILVVEDDPLNIEVLTRFLQERGYSVTSRTNAEEAMLLLESSTFDVILLDNVLPGMTGLQAIAELAQRSRAPIVVMTGGGDEEMKKDALLLGAKAFLHKPFDFDALLKTVESFAGQK